MLTRPKFRPHLQVEVVPGEGVFVLSGPRKALLRGRLYELVAPCLSGVTVDDVCNELHGRVSPAEIFFTLNQLESKKYLCEGQAVLSDEQAALWSSQQIAPEDAVKQLASRQINVTALGIDADPFLKLLESLHVRIGDGGDPDVVITDSYERDELSEINKRALQIGKPWLLARPQGQQLWFGPLFEPNVTACWNCFLHRMQTNSPVNTYLRERHASAIASDRASSPATLQIGWGLLANAVASWIVREELPQFQGKLQTLDLMSMQFHAHSLIRLPFCQSCGSPGEARPFQTPTIQARRKTFTADGGHRVVSPEKTIAKYEYHVSPLTGAVPMLERVSSGDGDGVMHVYLAGNNQARPGLNLAQLRGDLRSMSAGKGVTDAQAKASGLCEGLERYSGVFRGDEPRRHAKMSELGDKAISLNDCLLFSERQFRERVKCNAKASMFSFVPAPFNPEMEIDWSPVWSLTRQETQYLPTAFCYFDVPQPEHNPYCLGCSNGNAAGNTIEEAILQGFFELVERDSVALWWYNRVQRPAVDLDSVNDPFLQRLQDFLREHGREFWVLDLTADLEIPVFASISRRTDRPTEQIVLGFGAHLDPKLALLRAVTEMNQMLTSPLLDDISTEINESTTDSETAEWLRTATIANQPYLVPSQEPHRQMASYRDVCTDDVADDIRVCQERVAQAGLEMLFLDQTRPEIGLPVVKVIVPGLRHFWTRFAPGRLYDVPVKLGWLKRPLTEDELNPIPMFL